MYDAEGAGGIVLTSRADHVPFQYKDVFWYELGDSHDIAL